MRVRPAPAQAKPSPLAATSAATVAARTGAEDYEAERNYVLAVLGRRCSWLASDEREEVFHEAYAVLLEKQRDGRLNLDAMSPPQVRAYLTQTAIHKALDEGKRAGRNRSVPLGETAMEAPDERPSPDDFVAASIDSARVREIVGELSERRQAIVKLRFFFDRTPAEIQQYLGLSERAYRRELERSLRHLIERYRMVEEGSYCAERRSTILAFVAGIAGPGRSEAARVHLASCPSCARMAAELREVARTAAALMPPPLLTIRGRGGRVLAAAEELREAALNAISTVKQQLAGAAMRGDPGSAGYASAARPGAVAATIAGCLAIGSGAAYCVIETLPPLRHVVGSHSERVRDHNPKPAREQRTTTPSTVTAAPTVATTPTTSASESAPQTQPSSSSRSRKSAAGSGKQEAAAAASTEFGFESSGETSAAASGAAARPTASSSSAEASAPAPEASSAPAAAATTPSSQAQAPSEFDP